MSNDFAEQLEKHLHELLPLVKALNFHVEEGRPGYVKVSMSRSPIVVNHFNAFHAGALYSFAETAAGAIITASFDLSRTTLINKRGEIKYRKMVKEKAFSEASFPRGDVVRIEAEIEEKGKTEFPYTITVMNQDNEVACEVTFDFYMRRNPE
jgi:acyl-coenzyme A thioesterase PaaI-like protein